jgi:hypothetical protein
MINFKRMSGVLCALTMLAGCAAQAPLVARCTGQAPRVIGGAAGGAPALVGVEYGTRATAIPLNSVQFSSWAAERSVSVEQLAASRASTNTVAVTARFLSCSDRDAAIRVRTSFFDAHQLATEPASAWQTVYLHPHLTAAYSEQSISTAVTNYLIEITAD